MKIILALTRFRLQMTKNSIVSTRRVQMLYLPRGPAQTPKDITTLNLSTVLLKRTRHRKLLRLVFCFLPSGSIADPVLRLLGKQNTQNSVSLTRNYLLLSAHSNLASYHDLSRMRLLCYPSLLFHFLAVLLLATNIWLWHLRRPIVQSLSH